MKAEYGGASNTGKWDNANFVRQVAPDGVNIKSQMFIATKASNAILDEKEKDHISGNLKISTRLSELKSTSNPEMTGIDLKSPKRTTSKINKISFIFFMKKEKTLYDIKIDI